MTPKDKTKLRYYGGWLFTSPDDSCAPAIQLPRKKGVRRKHSNTDGENKPLRVELIF